jgi:asparagine synthase (glutamine-hydrolysing)
LCGIVGIVDLKSKRPIDRDLLVRMNTSIAHRGPDGDGVHIEPGVGFGHRRLSIIDLSGGAQPIYNEDGTVVLVYNGEIYNYKPLMEELMARGHKFRTHCDTEVVIHAWEEWGAESLRRFNGMFALALWDQKRECLFIARDRLGKKPLYYTQTADGLLLFGSELKTLLAYPQLDRRLDPRAVEDYFAFGYVPDPKCILASVRKLPPGTFIVAERGKPLPQPRSYWELRFAPDVKGPENAVADELAARFRDAVSRRLMSEVPLGSFLSGGVDSSSVVAAMSEVMNEPVRTCSISFGDPRFNEAPHAAAVAERFKTRHRVEQVDPEDFSLVDQLAQVYDEPFADSSAIPTYRVCQLARRDVTVALSGDGGDEDLAGYRRYRWHMHEQRIRNLLPDAIRGPLFGLAGAVYPKMDWAPKFLRAKSTLQAIARSALEGYFHGVSIFPTQLRRGLYSDSFRRDLQGYEAIEVFHEIAKDAPVSDPLSLVQYLDYRTYLPGDILVKVDRASMAHSLEVRVPLLDYELVEWFASLDPGLKLRNGEGKYIFKKSMERYLPNDILYRPKMGFGVPLASWFRGPLRERLQSAIHGGSLVRSGIFDEKTLRRLVDTHVSGRSDHSSVLWALLMFDGFQRRVLGTA